MEETQDRIEGSRGPFTKKFNPQPGCDARYGSHLAFVRTGMLFTQEHNSQDFPVVIADATKHQRFLFERIESLGVVYANAFLTEERTNTVDVDGRRRFHPDSRTVRQDTGKNPPPCGPKQDLIRLDEKEFTGFNVAAA